MPPYGEDEGSFTTTGSQMPFGFPPHPPLRGAFPSRGTQKRDCLAGGSPVLVFLGLLRQASRMESRGKQKTVSPLAPV